MEAPTDSELLTMPATPDGKRPDWLTREQIDTVVEAMSAADLVSAMERFDAQKQATQWAVAAFDSAGVRLGMSNGSPTSEHVRMQDFSYLASKVSEVVNVDNPLSEGQEG